MTPPADLVEKVCSTLTQQFNRAREQFLSATREVGVRYCYIDDFLATELAQQIFRAFPAPNGMRLMSSFREKKYTSKNLDNFDPILKQITFAIQHPRVIEIVGRLTSIPQQIPDPSLYAGGLSAMTKGHFLNPHIDNSHDGSQKYYRTLNLLYYATPAWSLEDGGNLELWDKHVRKNVTIVSRFNRLVVMETNPWSWHSVSPVKADRPRCCVSNYYFSEASPTGYGYTNVTSFSARPEQPFRRVIAWSDNKIRQMMRRVVPRGLGRQDVYNGVRQ